VESAVLLRGEPGGAQLVRGIEGLTAAQRARTPCSTSVNDRIGLETAA
jgi:hypothetical protein